mmetsp:Transcript_33480/g.66140  ORF Transcript_33480/g.66140 Transcript_33480/m.66140 type:complete len:218 (+) Transcript_33480:624-1277(+)
MVRPPRPPAAPPLPAAVLLTAPPTGPPALFTPAPRRRPCPVPPIAAATLPLPSTDPRPVVIMRPGRTPGLYAVDVRPAAGRAPLAAGRVGHAWPRPGAVVRGRVSVAVPSPLPTAVPPLDVTRFIATFSNSSAAACLSSSILTSSIRKAAFISGTKCPDAAPPPLSGLSRTAYVEPRRQWWKGAGSDGAPRASSPTRTARWDIRSTSSTVLSRTLRA